MGTKKLVSVGDCINQGFDLEAQCHSCGRKQTIDPMTFNRSLIMSAKPTKLHEVEQLMRCEKCKKRACKLVPVPRF